jgi:hypothetical protein
MTASTPHQAATQAPATGTRREINVMDSSLRPSAMMAGKIENDTRVALDLMCYELLGHCFYFRAQSYE